MLIKLGTRRSKLALAQSGLVIAALKRVNPEIKVEVHEIVTTGDKLYDQDLALIGGKGLFLKEIEDQLLDGKIDIAVHSMKDVPASLPEGLVIDCMLERENVQDVFVSEKYNNLAELPEGAAVGTSSPRRRLQLLANRPDLKIISMRGNVNTRIDKLARGEYDAIVLAYAGIKRLGLDAHIKEVISTDVMLPAVGQGAIGIERNMHDEKLSALFKEINHIPTSLCVEAERSFMQSLKGDCTTPLAAYAQIKGDYIHLKVGYAHAGANTMRFEQAQDTIANRFQLGHSLAQRFLL